MLRKLITLSLLLLTPLPAAAQPRAVIPITIQQWRLGETRLGHYFLMCDRTGSSLVQAYAGEWVGNGYGPRGVPLGEKAFQMTLDGLHLAEGGVAIASFRGSYHPSWGDPLQRYMVQLWRGTTKTYEWGFSYEENGEPVSIPYPEQFNRHRNALRGWTSNFLDNSGILRGPEPVYRFAGTGLGWTYDNHAGRQNPVTTREIHILRNQGDYDDLSLAALFQQTNYQIYRRDLDENGYSYLGEDGFAVPDTLINSSLVCGTTPEALGLDATMTAAVNNAINQNPYTGIASASYGPGVGAIIQSGFPKGRD